MVKLEGEPLIYFNKMSSLPQDARRVLFIRSEVNSELATKTGEKGPVDDLVIEADRQDLQTEGAQVIHPLAFALPNVILQILAKI